MSSLNKSFHPKAPKGNQGRSRTPSSSTNTSGDSAPKNTLDDQIQTLQAQFNTYAESKEKDDPLVLMFNTLMVIIQQQQQIITHTEKKKKKSYGEPPSVEAVIEYTRQSSVVLSGMPEQQALTSTGRAEGDLAAVKQLLNVMEVEALPIDVHRMGRKGEKPRLLKVQMPNRTIVRQLFYPTARAKLKANNNFKDVYIRPSLSPETLAERHRLYAECAKKNTDEPDGNYVVYADRIIKKSLITKEWKATLPARS